jgi:hypothetical protein
VQEGPPRYHYRAPAMAGGLADHAWALHELLYHPFYQTKNDPPKCKTRPYEDVLDRLEDVSFTANPA